MACSFVNITGITTCAYKFINNKGFKCTWNSALENKDPVFTGQTAKFLTSILVIPKEYCTDDTFSFIKKIKEVKHCYFYVSIVTF